MTELNLHELERLVRMQEGSPAVAMKPDAVLAMIARIRELEQDAALLDAGCIMTHERNDFGEEYQCERRGIDLRASIRAAIDAARKEKGHG